MCGGVEAAIHQHCQHGRQVCAAVTGLHHSRLAARFPEESVACCELIGTTLHSLALVFPRLRALCLGLTILGGRQVTFQTDRLGNRPVDREAETDRHERGQADRQTDRQAG